MRRGDDPSVLLLPGLDGTARRLGPPIDAAPPGLSPRGALPTGERRSIDGPRFRLQTRPREAWEAIVGLVERVVPGCREGAGA